MISDDTALFSCEKRPASGALGVVVTNAPLGSAAGLEMLAAGGNAVDAAVAALLTLSVVEPMMVGIAGGGISHVRLPDGRHVVIDCLSSAPQGMRPDSYQPDPDAPPFSLATLGKRNVNGPSAVAVPGNLAGWYHLHQQYGRLPFADVVEPAIRAAARGFLASGYLQGAVEANAPRLSLCPDLAALFLPDGTPVHAGQRVVMPAYAESLRLIQCEGAAALHGGALGQALVDTMATADPDAAGYLSLEDLRQYRPIAREAIFGTYRGFQVAGPPPPASSGVHVTEMLNILEGYDLAAMGFGTPQTLHLLAETIRIAFEDRRAASGDPAFVDVPVEKYISKDYAAAARARIRDCGGMVPFTPGLHESRDTTHVTTADRDGMIVVATHTLNGLFGAGYAVPGTGIIPNNYMLNFDPTPGRAMSIAPGKRVPTSMAPMIVSRDGRPAFALGLPGAVRIFPSAMQAIVNIIDHKMTLQEAVEAPRIWTEGAHLEIEAPFAGAEAALAAMGHEVRQVCTIGGGMNAVAFADDGVMTGAACWRADGHAVALSGGAARPGTRFRI